jgi:serine/threonine-protein kinase
VTVYAFDISPEGVPYLIMEFVEGQSLSVLQNTQSLEFNIFFDVFIQVCSALAHAHSRGVIHRDIKPSNILATPIGSHSFWVKLADFGIAKMITGSESRDLTQTGDFLGSPYYASPEQAQGDEVDARSDIYSLGCVMFEALTGQPPFVGPSAVKVILQHINDLPPSLTSLNLKCS